MMSSTYDAQNIFAKILRGEIAAEKVYEDEAVVVIMDVMPQAAGHVLVIPKSPARNLMDAGEDVLGPLMVAAQKMARAVKVAFAADGVTLNQYNEAAGGQSVFHLHVHVIPRFDGVPLKGHTGEMESADVLAANAEKIRQALS
jgi:histidine triad (HIT) family protein